MTTEKLRSLRSQHGRTSNKNGTKTRCQNHVPFGTAVKSKGTFSTSGWANFPFHKVPYKLVGKHQSFDSIRETTQVKCLLIITWKATRRRPRGN